MSYNLWAPVVKPKRGAEWVVHTCVRSTRRDAKRAYLEGVNPAYHAAHLSRVRFAKVTVSIQAPAPQADQGGDGPGKD